MAPIAAAACTGEAERPLMRRRRSAAVAAAAAGIVAMAAMPAGAQESIEQEVPTPSSVRQSLTTIERAFQPAAQPPSTLFPQFREQVKDMPAFFRDARFEVSPRSYYRDRKNLDQSTSEAWAVGGAVSLQSGWLFDRFAIGGVYYGSLPLYAPEDRDGTGLLLPSQQGYGVLGQIYGRIRLDDQTNITIGRAAYDTPYISRDDSRMTPNTFTAYTLLGTIGSGDGPRFRYGAGYFTEIKQKNSEKFVSMSKAAGVQTDRGVFAAGGLLTMQTFSIGAVNYYSDDIINILYGEAKYGIDLPGDLGAVLAAQYVDQRSVGQDLLTGSSFSTNQFGLKALMGGYGWILTLAYTQADDSAKLQNPWSGNPFYTDSMIQGFNRPGERAGLAKLSYDFTDLGLTGVSAYVQYTYGSTDAAAAGPQRIKESEVDFDVQWRPNWPILKGLWLRARYGVADIDEGGNNTRVRDLRLIANYTALVF